MFIEQIDVADEFITSKNTDLTRFFIIKPRHTAQLKNISGWKKPSVGALHGNRRQNAYEHLKIYCSVIVTQ